MQNIKKLQNLIIIKIFFILKYTGSLNYQLRVLFIIWPLIGGVLATQLIEVEPIWVEFESFSFKWPIRCKLTPPVRAVWNNQIKEMLSVHILVHIELFQFYLTFFVLFLWTYQVYCFTFFHFLLVITFRDEVTFYTLHKHYNIM